MEEAEYQQRAAELALRLARPDIRQVQPTPQQNCPGRCHNAPSQIPTSCCRPSIVLPSCVPVDDRMQQWEQHAHVVHAHHDASNVAISKALRP